MQFNLTLADGGFLRLGETFEWRGNVYRLDKLNPRNAQITDATGKHYNLAKSEIAARATKSDVVINAASFRDKIVTNREERHIETHSDRIKPGMVVTYRGHEGLWVVLKFQPRTNRFDIVKLGGDPQGREWAWRTSGVSLTPVDAINNMVK